MCSFQSYPPFTPHSVDASEVPGAPPQLTFECIDLDREGTRFATGSEKGQVVMWERKNDMKDGYGVVEFKMALKDVSKQEKQLKDSEETLKKVIKEITEKNTGGLFPKPIFKIICTDKTTQDTLEENNVESYGDSDIQVVLWKKVRRRRRRWASLHAVGFTNLSIAALLTRPSAQWKATEDAKKKEDEARQQRKDRRVSSPGKSPRKTRMVRKDFLVDPAQGVKEGCTDLGYFDANHPEVKITQFEVLGGNSCGVEIKQEKTDDGGDFWYLTCQPAKVGKLNFAIKATGNDTSSDTEEFEIEVFKDYSAKEKTESEGEIDASVAKANANKDNAAKKSADEEKSRTKEADDFKNALRDCANDRKGKFKMLQSAKNAGVDKNPAHNKKEKVTQVLCNANENEHDSFLYTCAGEELKVWNWVTGSHVEELRFIGSDTKKKHNIEIVALAIDETAKNRFDAQIKEKEMEIQRQEKVHLKVRALEKTTNVPCPILSRRFVSASSQVVQKYCQEAKLRHRSP